MLACESTVATRLTKWPLGVTELVRDQRSSGTRAREAGRSSGWSRYLATWTPGRGGSAAGEVRRSSAAEELDAGWLEVADDGDPPDLELDEGSDLLLSKEK